MRHLDAFWTSQLHRYPFSPILVVEDSTCQHILVADGDGGRFGVAGVVKEGYLVGVDCLILEPAGKIKKNKKQYIPKIT